MKFAKLARLDRTALLIGASVLAFGVSVRAYAQEAPAKTEADGNEIVVTGSRPIAESAVSLV